MEQVPLQIEGLIFDDENREHLAKHNVTELDVFDMLENQPKFFTNLPGRSAPNVVLGPSSAGRFLFVAIAPVEYNLWMPVTAHWMQRRRALRYYEGEA
jgi:hypothetical protein